jgi:hypothetical protein
VPVPEPPGPGYCEIPAWAFGSEPRPVSSLPAPEPCPCNPLPGPLPLPMPGPPPLPPSPVFAVPLGDMAIAPAPVLSGSPSVVPGRLDTTTPVTGAFPPELLGGATADPMSSGFPVPVPLLPRPLPDRALPPPSPGGGGTTSADPTSEPDAWLERAPFFGEACPSRLAGGGTTWGARALAPDLKSEPVLEAVGGGGTGLVRMSPLAVFPQLLRSRLTCDGGGATTAGAGSDSFAADDMFHSGAATGGATTSTVWVSGTRELAKSRCVSRGAGAMTVCWMMLGAS